MNFRSIGLRFAAIHGLIRRRILVNFRADPVAIRAILPPPFVPKLHEGHAVVGICLIRLEQIRPKAMPLRIGLTSENAAHRIAVEWQAGDGSRSEGVYIARRDTGSWLNYMTGGRIFPGQHSMSHFRVEQRADELTFNMHSQDKKACVRFRGTAAQLMPENSIFRSLADASGFFEKGCIGFSPRMDSDALDGLQLCTYTWNVEPLEVQDLESIWYSDQDRFPKGSVAFDHALIMRNIAHEWKAVTLDDSCAAAPKRIVA